MLRNLINGSYDNVNNKAENTYQPGELASDKAKAAAAAMGAKPPPVAAPVPLQLKNVAPAAPAPLPPEVLAARELKEAPKENHVGVETLFGEDLISEKSLDEVILSYLASDGQ
jgi:hypothetical protein